ncbi:MAG TPA: hypothetical protein VG713_20505 [Pirellulales bacterium]|nr:hypothetical protein [Pirellulales bacterium]
MNFALLEIDEHTRALVAAAELAGHRISAAYDAHPASVEAIRSVAPAAEIVDHWEALLGDGVCDAVIVARAAADEESVRDEQLRTFLQAEMPLLVAHPFVDAMLTYVTIDLYRQDSQSPLVPYAPERSHPAIEQLATIIGQGEASSLGRVEQVVCERFLSDRSKRGVFAAFVSDCDLARRLCGEFDKLGALAASNSDNRWATLAVQMSAIAGVITRWSVVPSANGPAARWTIVAASGKAVLHAPNDSPWKLELQTGDESIEHEYPGWSAAGQAIDDLIAATQGNAPGATWFDAYRDLELADAVDRSLARGRTIDLYHEDVTEHSTFKGMMAAGGCLVLLVALGLLIVATTLGNLHVPGASAWPYVLVAGLVLFLLLQTLKFAFPPESREIVTGTRQEERP